MVVRTLLFATLIVLAGCGGSGGSVLAPPEKPMIAVPPAGQAATLTVSIPRKGVASSAHSRRPAFVSPNSTTFQATINSLNGVAQALSPTTIPLTTTGTHPNCMLGVTDETCTLVVPAPVGSVNYTFSVLDAQNAILATTTQTITILAGTANVVSAVTLHGVVTSVSAGSVPTLRAGAALTTTVPLFFQDASGATITGTFDTPVTFTDTDSSTHTGLVLNGTCCATSVTATKASDTVGVMYDGVAVIPSFTLAVSGSHIPNGTAIPIATAPFPIVFALVPGQSGTLGTANGVQILSFASSTSTNLTATEQQDGGMLSVTQTANGVGCETGSTSIVAVVSVTSAGPGALTLSVSGQTTGQCTIGIIDSSGQTFDLSVTVM